MPKITLPDRSGPPIEAIDSILSAVAPGVTYADIRTGLTEGNSEEAEKKIKALEAKLSKADTNLKNSTKEISGLSAKLKDLSYLTATKMPEIKHTSSEGTPDIPNGEVEWKDAHEVFSILKEGDFNAKVPVWKWDGPHPRVPAIDEKYVLRKDYLLQVLYSIVTNQRMYIQGHTGSGKTTLIEQVAAHLNYPFFRINFDSEITRMDLIGRDTLTTDSEGKTVSTFVDGALPEMMSGPHLACFDEIDFTRPDVAYVMQAALEGNSLTITEDGGRVVTPDPMFRMFATGNTVGQGDEHGMYQGARPQSLAFLDRFTLWLKVDYMKTNEYVKLVKEKVPTLAEKDAVLLGKYITEHFKAFTGATITQPLSPRGMLAIANYTTIFGLKAALTACVLNKANEDDRAVLEGIIDRVL